MLVENYSNHIGIGVPPTGKEKVIQVEEALRSIENDIYEMLCDMNSHMDYIINGLGVNFQIEPQQGNTTSLQDGEPSLETMMHRTRAMARNILDKTMAIREKI